ncbi:hypothetical protein N8J89_08415 [Crossiella sp. CA-258035]|uniref:hypothetical protein n=1 Tax=Crossiella sp. CA-258035 TaxID=2981138 RepID=UPI0024BCCD2B|nr:hypothetical protein [Crossiella sp. CA-258035]WHT21075.1 hypothetical protein N8J89_08415 [Crossiella sp. CA-258035]
MFDRTVQLAPSLGRVYDRSRPVWVDLNELYRHGFLGDASSATLLIRQQGLVVSGRVPGTLHAWLRTEEGYWAGLVSFCIAGRSESTVPPLALKHLVPRGALRPRAPEERGAERRY